MSRETFHVVEPQRSVKVRVMLRAFQLSIVALDKLP